MSVSSHLLITFQIPCPRSVLQSRAPPPKRSAKCRSHSFACTSNNSIIPSSFLLEPASKSILQRRKLRDGGSFSDLLMLNRILISRDELTFHNTNTHSHSSAHCTLRPTDFRALHITNVLKSQNNDVLKTGILNGILTTSTVFHDPSNSNVILHFTDPVESLLSSSDHHHHHLEKRETERIDVVLAMPRPKVMLRLFSSLSAIGVSNLYIVNAFRVEKGYLTSSVMHESEYGPELILGLMQAGCDTRIPKVSVQNRLQKFLVNEFDGNRNSDAENHEIRLIAHPSENSQSVLSVLSKRIQEIHEKRQDYSRIVLAFGPEGGWMPREMSMFCDQFGFHPVSLGPRILRTEQAVIALTSLTHQILNHHNTQL